MRIVIDTNVAVSGLLWQGPPNQILKWAREGILRIIACERTTSEFKRVIQYKKFAQRLSVLNVTSAEVFAYYMNLIFYVTTPESIPEQILEDPFDNVFPALASENKAALIISGDDHLLRLKEYDDIQIVTPGEACSIIEMISAKG